VFLTAVRSCPSNNTVTTSYWGHAIHPLNVLICPPYDLPVLSEPSFIVLIFDIARHFDGEESFVAFPGKSIDEKEAPKL
jgi:hypothetical protein